MTVAEVRFVLLSAALKHAQCTVVEKIIERKKINGVGIANFVIAVMYRHLAITL